DVGTQLIGTLDPGVSRGIPFNLDSLTKFRLLEGSYNLSTAVATLPLPPSATPDTPYEVRTRIVAPAPRVVAQGARPIELAQGLRIQKAPEFINRLFMDLGRAREGLDKSFNYQLRVKPEEIGYSYESDDPQARKQLIENLEARAGDVLTTVIEPQDG